MRSLIGFSFITLASLTAFIPVAKAQQLIDFETQGCGRLQQKAYYRTEFHDVNICFGEANLLMIVTDNDGLGRERLAVQKKGESYEGTSEQGITYRLDGSILTISLPNQTPIQEKVTRASLEVSSPSFNYRYDCLSQVAPLPSRTNVSLQEAEQLVLERDGNSFIYQCSPAAQATSVTGIVIYRQRIALPSNAVVEVKLQEASRADAPATTLAEQTIMTQGRQVPIPFTLSYNPDQINPQSIYIIQARILIDGKLRWINTSNYSVITQGNPTQVEVIVNQVN